MCNAVPALSTRPWDALTNAPDPSGALTKMAQPLPSTPSLQVPAPRTAAISAPCSTTGRSQVREPPPSTTLGAPSSPSQPTIDPSGDVANRVPLMGSRRTSSPAPSRTTTSEVPLEIPTTPLPIGPNAESPGFGKFESRPARPDQSRPVEVGQPGSPPLHQAGGVERDSAGHERRRGRVRRGSPTAWPTGRPSPTVSDGWLRGDCGGRRARGRSVDARRGLVATTRQHRGRDCRRGRPDERPVPDSLRLHARTTRRPTRLVGTRVGGWVSGFRGWRSRTGCRRLRPGRVRRRSRPNHPGRSGRSRTCGQRCPGRASP